MGDNCQESDELRAGLLCLAVEQAFRHNNRGMAIVALDGLLATDSFSSKLLVLRCLVRLTYTELPSLTTAADKRYVGRSNNRNKAV